jgi:hypothetical protein
MHRLHDYGGNSRAISAIGNIQLGAQHLGIQLGYAVRGFTIYMLS